MQKWWTFILERFEPISHTLMIALFFSAHYTLFVQSEKATMLPFTTLLTLALGTIVFFFKLRLYDEIKDYEVDTKINPTRPLARGLVTHSDLYRGIAVCIILELVCFGIRGTASLMVICISILYSLLMYKEFFIGQKIRPFLTTYAVTHTIISTFISLSLFTSFSQTFPWEQEFYFILFALNSWCLFNIFEFGRKTFTQEEERENVESYSKIFGRTGAVLLVLSMAALSAYLLKMIPVLQAATYTYYWLILLILLSAIGLSYAALNKKPYGMLYRAFSSIHIILVYGYLVIGHLVC